MPSKLCLPLVGLDANARTLNCRRSHLVCEDGSLLLGLLAAAAKTRKAEIDRQTEMSPAWGLMPSCPDGAVVECTAWLGPGKDGA